MMLLLRSIYSWVAHYHFRRLMAGAIEKTVVMAMRARRVLTGTVEPSGT